MMKGNVAAALASSAVRLTESSYQLIKGKISIEEFLQTVGENAVTTFQELYSAQQEQCFSVLSVQLSAPPSQC